MSLKSEQRLCKIHNQLIIATDLKDSCNEESRYLCGQCLIQKTKEQTIHINEVAQSYLDDIKNEYLQIKTKKIEKTQNILRQLSNSIDEIKLSIEQICEKISQQIIQESERQSILLENLDQTIKSIDVYNFNELFPKLQDEDIENSKSLFQSILQSQIQQISNHQKIEEFLKCVNSFEIQSNQQEFYQTDQKQQQLDENQIDTPGLKIICQNHNREIIAFDLDPERAKENRLACIYCIEESPIKYFSLTYVQKQWNQLQELQQKKLKSLQQQNSEYEQLILQQLNIFKDVLQQKNNEIIDYLKEHSSMINNVINLVFQNINENWQNLQKNNILDILETLANTQLNDEISFKQENEILQEEIKLNKNIHNSLQKVKETFVISLQKISEKMNCDQDQFSLNTLKQHNNKELKLNQNEFELKLQIQSDQKQFNIKQTQTETISQFQGSINYTTMQNHQIKQNDNFRALGFTKEDDFLIAGCNKSIQIYKFCLGQLELVQQLDKHDYNICSIYIMKKSKCFVSGDFIGKIIFWILEDNKWKSIIEVKEHSDYVNQIIMNKDENEMITCSDDKCINFYTKEQEWKCIQTIKNHQNNVNAISLNASETILISCGFDSIISVIVKDQIEGQWQVKQTIKNEFYGYRICFIKNNDFLFQPQGVQKMWLYQKLNESGEFEKTKEFDVNKINCNCSRWFQMEYKEENQLLLCKNGNCVNLFKVQDDCSLKAEQTISFETQGICGSMSSDSLYLILWDEKSKQFQIRMLYND